VIHGDGFIKKRSDIKGEISRLSRWCPGMVRGLVLKGTGLELFVIILGDNPVPPPTRGLLMRIIP
jgi:hypothetical protein